MCGNGLDCPSTRPQTDSWVRCTSGAQARQRPGHLAGEGREKETSQAEHSRKTVLNKKRRLSTGHSLSQVAGLHSCSPELRRRTAPPTACHTCSPDVWFVGSLFGFYWLGFPHFNRLFKFFKGRVFFLTTSSQPPASIG